ncbi:hypothetical protein JXL83_05365 [candidate division WOR-3 bacterium]|nr:hypothetical protein [candidate division WOR-3 bacterium]
MISAALQDVEKVFTGKENVKGIMIFSLTGKTKHSNLSIPIQDSEDIGRSLVILWDALKKSGIKGGVISWIYAEGLIYMKDFDGGFIVSLTSSKSVENEMIQSMLDSSELLKGTFTDESEKSILSTIEEKKTKKIAAEQMLTESGLNEIVKKVKDSASNIAGSWIEYYFDDLVQEWIDMTQPRKSHLKNLVKAVSEYIDEGAKRNGFLNESSNIIGE